MPRSTTDGNAADDPGGATRDPGGATRGRSRRNFAGSRPVMDDVARLAGVSKQTVSRVLNDHPAVRPETREAVLEAMRTLGYRPSRSARSLASGRTRMLGVISFDAARYGPASTLTAINTAAQEAGYLVSSIALDTADRDTVVQAVDRLSAEGADGIIAIAPQRPVGHGPRARPASDTPLVMLDNGLGDGHPRGHRRLPAGARHGHRTSAGPRPPHRLAHRGPHRLDVRRPPRRELARDPGRGPAHASTSPSPGDWSADSGYELGRRLARPTGTSPRCSSPTTRWRSALLRALHEAGRRVPRRRQRGRLRRHPRGGASAAAADHDPHGLLRDRHDGAALAVEAVGRPGVDG